MLFSLSYLIYFLEIWRRPFVESLSNDSKIYWDNEEDILHDKLKTGFGEQGEAGFLKDPLEKEQNEILFKEFGMSPVISDKL